MPRRLRLAPESFPRRCSDASSFADPHHPGSSAPRTCSLVAESAQYGALSLCAFAITYCRHAGRYGVAPERPPRRTNPYGTDVVEVGVLTRDPDGKSNRGASPLAVRESEKNGSEWALERDDAGDVTASTARTRTMTSARRTSSPGAVPPARKHASAGHGSTPRSRPTRAIADRTVLRRCFEFITSQPLLTTPAGPSR